jgi:multiple sugar transport system ATP-binding protein
VASVTLEDVTKVYANDVTAVRDLSLEIADGEFVVLVGPSGCGKTTVLRMVAGLEDITAGRLRIGDRDVTNVAPKERDVAMVFQNYALYPHLTVAQNIGFALKLRRMPKADITAKVREAAEVLGLLESLDRKPKQLSGGQRQRVAMGRAIVRQPSVFLMDEPLSNLDAQLRVTMRAEVSRIARRIGVATLYVTHDQIEAMTMGDRVAVIRDGVLQQYDAPQVLYARPVNLFVAAFIGSPQMNLFEASLSADGSSIALGSQTVPLPEQVRREHPKLASYGGQKLVVGLRPEHLPAATVAHEGLPVLAGDVDLIEDLGSELLVHFTIDAPRVKPKGATEIDEPLALSGSGVARIDPDVDMKAGQRARFAVNTRRMQFFDSASGSAIWD